jgi:prepilin-type N-terminal cleavage/methylation domain-containing protein
MQPTSAASGPPPSAAKSVEPKRGFTLFEMLIVLVIISLTTVLALPMISGALDRAGAQVAMFDFQRQVLDLRADAYRSQTPILVQAAAPLGAPAAEPRPLQLSLANGWSYSLSSAIAIDTLGGCSAARVDLAKAGLKLVSLQNVAGDCHFRRS